MLKHAFTSTVPDDSDETLVRPSNWNADHVIDNQGATFNIASSTPSAPESGKMKLYSFQSDGMLPTMEFQDSAGRKYNLGDFVDTGNFYYAGGGAVANGGFSFFRIGALSLTGTGLTYAEMSFSSTNKWYTYPQSGRRTGTTDGNSAGIYASTGATPVLHTNLSAPGYFGFYYKLRFGYYDQDNTVSTRSFAGLGRSIPPSDVESSTLLYSIGVGTLSTDLTQLYLFYGGSVAQTPIALGTALGAPQRESLFQLELFAPSSLTRTVYYKVTNMITNATVEGVISGTAAAIPDQTVNLFPRIYTVTKTPGKFAQINVVDFYYKTNV